MDPTCDKIGQSDSTLSGMSAADSSLLDVHQEKQAMDRLLFWRDLREIGTSFLLIPAWVFFGIRVSLPWCWYLVIPALLWVGGFMLAYRVRHQQRSASQDLLPLRQQVENSIQQLDQQIWLLRNVHWWALLPMLIPMVAFVLQVSLSIRLGILWSILPASLALVLFASSFLWIYQLNQEAIQKHLEPKRQQLLSFLLHLQS